MSTTFKSKLQKALNRIQVNDTQLNDELKRIRSTTASKEKARSLSPALEGLGNSLEVIDSGFALETIVLRTGRPVLAISMDEAVLEFRDAESEVWRSRLIKNKSLLKSAIQAVGRIELQHHATFSWVGTGWLVTPDIVVTNRHVAEVFAEHQGKNFVFKSGLGGKRVEAAIDFLEEHGRSQARSFELTKVLYIEPSPGPDLAFIKVKSSGSSSPKPIKLAAKQAALKQDVVVIGYPARDSRIPDQQLMLDIFGDVYDKKRLAPGQVIGSTSSELKHDCSTLGGNSGSVVLNLETGEAVGLHFAGRFLESNFAVSAGVIKTRLQQVLSNEIKPHNSKPEITTQKLSHESINLTIPLKINISLGQLMNASPSITVSTHHSADEEDEQFFTEGKAADYSKRKGYEATFLGPKVPLPVITKATSKSDILKFKNGKKEEFILPYCHFSLIMSKSRRQCFFSAVNINGETSVSMKRGPWRLDPRIPESAQIMKECYGNAPKFSRGHMTRREDPIWGSPTDAKLGNDDSMHVTNAIPQMQTMNAGIWLGLENYALQNARKDDMKISVFTGPFFTKNDPVKYGIKIPLSFWKVIAFIHDNTGKLCATGYTISQEDFLQEEEFVYGEHKTYQIPIARIEKDSGISFGKLTKLDPLYKQPEGLESELTDYQEIKFV